MFEKVVATILHRYLGKYIQDLDTENLNLGIFGGEVQLSDLKIKPDALYELDLPFEVKVGTIGRINIKIPWGRFNKQCVSVEVEEVYIIAAPITDRDYDPEKEKRLMRASNRRKLELLESGTILGSDAPESQNFLENLITTIMNTLQVFVHNIHIRYEDSVMSEAPFACGLCLQSLSIETTNSKWKPTTTVQSQLSSIYQLVRLDSLSIYCNPVCSELVGKQPGVDSAAPYTWRADMKRGLETFSVRGEEFDFILKPLAIKIKLIVNKSNEARVPKLLVDFVLQDAATQLSRLQYLALIELAESFKRIEINRRFRQFHPGKKLSGNASLWWKYAYNGVLEQRVRPYTRKYIENHRKNFKRYCNIYKQSLLKPADTEVKLDLQQCEDELTIADIVIAREQTKFELLKEAPEKVRVVEKVDSWWRSKKSPVTRKEIEVSSVQGRGIWTQLSPNEKSKLFEAIGYSEEATAIEKPKQYIEHKINFTLANCSLSLVKRGHEIMVITLAQFLASLETRPAAKAFKVSTRVESFVIEGVTNENDLVPIITADNNYTGNTSVNFLSVDFEKNPLNSEANYGLTITMEPVEIVYHENAISECISFLQAGDTSITEVVSKAGQLYSPFLRQQAQSAIERCSALELNINAKLPYFVIPELGTLQKGGNLIILDLGQVKATSELQPKNINLDDATQMEIEERLYNRFYVEINDFQILFCDSGDVWRDSKKLADSEFHLLPKIQLQVAYSNSVKPDYKLLPRHKLNITVTSLKVNVSDRKIGNVLDFADNLPLPSINTVHVSVSSNIDTILAELPDFNLDEVNNRAQLVDELLRIKTTIVEILLNSTNYGENDGSFGVTPNIDKEAAKIAMLTVDKNFLSSDHSDEEIELWARTVDLPGFDDNVSPNNVITMLLRFIVGEVVIQLCRSCNRVDKPYLMLRIVNVCCDAALMEYGPAVQASISGIQLIDKLHTGITGQYLELIATESPGDVATLLYRKVRADCPDFKSHFHNVEQSLVLDFTAVSLVVHREAIVTLNKYMQYLFQKIQNRDMVLLHRIFKELPLDKFKSHWQTQADPPVPPGATKFSYSTRIQEIKLKLCDTDLDFLEIKINGLESDCLFKANERMVLQFYLNSVAIDDLSGMTLYPKVLTVEDDKIVQFKYVRHSPRFYKDIDLKKDDVKSDGSFKLQIGRVQVVFLTKMFIDLQHFLEPFVKQSNVCGTLYKLDKMFSTKFNLLRSSSTKLHVALDIHTPSFLFPQKASLPDLIILCLGDLIVENFFKEKNPATEGVATPVVDNILVRLSNVQLCRAIMTLGGNLEVREPILEPFSIKIDLKRTVNFNDAKAVTLVTRSNGSYPSSSQLLLYQLEGIVDSIRINLGQRDLMTILSVWNDNFNSGIFLSDFINFWSNWGPSDLTTPVPNGDEQAVKKLQAFFYHNEQSRKEATMRMTLDCLQLYLFVDCDEMLSSPVRDMNHGLCKLETGETCVSVDVFSDRSLEMKASLQTCTVEDIRRETEPSRKKLFQCHNNTQNPDEDTNISVSSPPFIDSTFKQTQSGDQVLDILVESTRFNLPVSFILEFTRFLVDSLPLEKTADGGLINFGYVGDTSAVQSKQVPEIVRPPSSTDSTSGYFSSRASCTDDQSGICVSLQLRRPEILLYTSNDHSLLFQTEILVDYTRHPGRESLVVSFSGLGVLSRHHSSTNKDETPYSVLHPCDIEFARTFKASDANLKVTAYVSFVDVHITPKVVHVLSSIKDEFTTALIPDELDPSNVIINNAEIEDLWSPKKVAPYNMSRPTDAYCCGRGSSERISENLVVTVPKVRFMFEKEDLSKRVPMMLFKMAADFSAYNWSTSLQMKGTLQMQMSYFNCQIGAWEPLLEPCVEEEGIYRPIEIHLKLFRAKAYLIQPRLNAEDTTGEHEASESTVAKLARHKSVSKKTVNSEESETSADEQDAETGSMVFIRRQHHKSESGGKAKHESVSMISYPEDSDSDNEEGVMEKLASAISHLFTGDSSDGDASDTNDSSGAEPSPDTDEATDVESMASIANGKDSRPILIKKHSDSDDSGLETEGVDKMATYLMVDIRDRVEITVTSQSLKVIDHLHTAFTHEALATAGAESSLTLINDLTPKSSVTLLSKAEVGPAKVLITATYDHSDSIPSSPASSTAPTDFFSPVGSDVDGDFCDDGFYSKKVEMDSTAELHSPYLRFPIEPVSCLYKKVTDHRVHVKIPGFDEVELLCPQRTCNKLHLLQPMKNNTRYYVVLNVVCHDWGQRVTLRSPLQVKNETCYALALFYKRSVLESLSFEVIGETTNPFEDTNRIAIVEPDETFNVPITVAHHCKIYVQPAHVDNYSISETSLWWQELAGDLASPKDITCPAKDDKDSSTFSLRAICEEGVPAHRPSRLIPKYTIRLLPPLSFNNRLPYAVEISLTSINYQVRVEAGENASIYSVNLSKCHKVVVNVPSYLGIVWSGNFTLSQDVEEKIISMTTEQETEGGNKQLGLNMKVERQGTCEVTLFAPYWIINKTGLPLQLRASLTDVVYEAQGEEPLLFCYRKQRKPCVRLRAYHSSWSSAFSMDAFGTSGLVICKDRERKRKYRILLKSELSEVSPQCAKIVSLLPNFIISNETKRHLRFMEENEKADLWIDLAPSQTVPFWPETDKMCLFVKFRDSKVVSQHFPISSNHETVLRMDKGGALCVKVSGGGDRPFTIIFRNYICGDAPVRVDNLCEDLFLKVHQQHLGQVALLSPYQTMLYTWDDPCKERFLHWNVYNKKCKDYMTEIHKDGYGQEKLSFHMVKKQQSTPTPTVTPPTVTAKLSASLKRFSSSSQVGPSSSSEDSESDELQKPQLTKKTRKDKVVVYWVSYLEGPQRVLMFTQDERVAYKARLKIDAEKSYLEIFLSLKGFGLSLSNFIKGDLQEVGYISIKDSAPLWEVSVAHKWKPLTLELATWVEDRWKQEVKKSQMKELVHVDFEKMHMTKPFYGELRRRVSPGLWLQYRKSPSYSYFECKIHRIQVENQMFNAIFPIVLYCKPLSKSLLRKSGDHPCVEVAVLKRHQNGQKHDIFKSTKVLIQEFVLQLDKNFVVQMFNLYSPWIRDCKPSVRIRSDIAALHQPLSTWCKVSKEPAEVVEYVHVSPICLQLSFIFHGGSSSSNSTLQHQSYGKSYEHDFVNFIFDALTPSHLEVKGLSIRTTYFERKGLVDTKENLFNEVLSHYTSQILPQIHVLVFGLDILGNPYSPVTDFTGGLGDLFYEPTYFRLESPEEYSEGLSTGAQMLMGLIKGCHGSSTSLITTGLTDTNNCLRFEEDVKKSQRRRLYLQQTSSLPAMLLNNSRTFEVGVALGMSGLIIKQQTGTAPFGQPHSGLQQHDGIEIFFRSIGRGLMGLMTKPTGGVIDCLSMASDGIKRASETGEDFILRTRQPRHADQFLGLRPYSCYEAAGRQLLVLTNKGHYADSDVYWCHAPLSPDGKTYLLVTLHHVFLIEKCRLWGSWEIEWGVRVDDVMSVPTINNNQLIFKVRQDETFTYLNGDERTVTCDDATVLDWLQKRIEAVMILNMEDKPCPLKNDT